MRRLAFGVHWLVDLASGLGWVHWRIRRALPIFDIPTFISLCFFYFFSEQRSDIMRARQASGRVSYLGREGCLCEREGWGAEFISN